VSNLRHARFVIRIILGVLLAVDVVAAAILLTPLARAGAARQAEFDAVRRQVQQKLKTVVPPDQVQKRVEEARTQIDAFYQDRLPGSASALSSELGKLAAANHVRLNGAKYRDLESDLPGLSHVRIDATISGDYLSAVKFINAAERDKSFFIIDNVSLTEQQGGGNVGLNVALETYLKTGAE
jgi:Tfp pilus assembly protein PilO